MNKVSIPFLIIFISLFFNSRLLSQSAYEIAKEMFAATKEIKSMTYTMKKQERIKGELPVQVTSVKMVSDPYKVYLHQDEPNVGMEVLYVAEKSKKALINPNGFPWVNVRLDPYGSTMRKNQHHTIHNAGLYYVVSILEYLFNKYEPQTASMIKLLDSASWEGKNCYVIMLDNPNYTFVDHKVKKGEDLITIADSLKLSEYMILENNSDIEDYKDVKVGQTIKIPNDYSPKMILYIEKERMIPLVMKVYDDKGIYEYYEYTNVVINPSFKPDEFSKNYGEYGF